VDRTKTTSVGRRKKLILMVASGVSGPTPT